MLAKPGVLAAEVGMGVNEGELVRVKGLGQVVVGSKLEGFDRGSNTAFTRHEYGQGVFRDQFFAQ